MKLRAAFKIYYDHGIDHRAFMRAVFRLRLAGWHFLAGWIGFYPGRGPARQDVGKMLGRPSGPRNARGRLIKATPLRMRGAAAGLTVEVHPWPPGQTPLVVVHPAGRGLEPAETADTDNPTQEGPTQP